MKYKTVASEVDVHIIYTESRMLLSKKYYASWRQIQDEFDDYKTSLGPWSPEHVIDYLASEYSDLSPSASDQVRALLGGSEEASALNFA